MSVKILHGDCREVLAALPEGSVQCCVTSPPYWGLRSYLPDDDPLKVLEIGSERTVDEWVQTMVEVFRKVRRVLRDDGTLFLNLGDSYHGGGRGGEAVGGSLNGRQTNHARDARRRHEMFTAAQRNASSEAGRARPVEGLKPKDLIGQPWLVAFALRADGWWLRQELIWSKANPMPESARDRCTKSHEHIFLLSKSEKYYWDFEAMQEPVNGGAHARRPMEYSGAKRPGFGHGYDKTPKARYRTPAGWDTSPGDHRGLAGRYAAVGRREGPPGNPAEQQVKNNASMDEALADVRSTRNPRSVWTASEDEFQQFLAWKAQQLVAPDVWAFPTEPFKGAHFATFPQELARRCITAGTQPGDVVLDPFGGSGTVGLVADGMHRSAILIDLDRRNVPMAKDRIAGDAPLFVEISATEEACDS